MHQIRQRRRLGEKRVMNHLTASQRAILPGMETKWDHNAVNGIKNGYYPSESDQVNTQVGHAQGRTWSLFH